MYLLISLAVQPCPRPYPIRLQPQTSSGADFDIGVRLNTLGRFQTTGKLTPDAIK